MRSTNIALILMGSAFLLSACSGDDETCAEGANCSGTGGGSTSASTSNSTGGTGGSGGGSVEGLTVPVLVTDSDLTPVADAPVVVNAVDGSIVSEAATDADGGTVVTIPPGGSVTAFRTVSFLLGNGQPLTAKEAISAYPGDEMPARIVLQGHVFPATPEAGPAEPMELGVSYNTKPGAADYDVQIGCFRETVPGLVGGGIVYDCSNDGLYDVLIVARDAGGKVLDYKTLDDQTFMPDTTELHQMSWSNSPVASIPYSVTNIPDGSQRVVMQSTAERITHGVPIVFDEEVEVTAPSQRVTGSMTQPVNFGTTRCGFARVYADQYNFTHKARCGNEIDLTPFQFDAGRLTRFEGSGTVFPAELAWEEDVAGAAGDGVVFFLRSQGAALFIVWHGVMGVGAGEVSRPELPAALGDYHIDPDADPFWSISHVDSPARAGFKELLEEGRTLENEEYHFHHSP